MRGKRFLGRFITNATYHNPPFFSHSDTLHPVLFIYKTELFLRSFELCSTGTYKTDKQLLPQEWQICYVQERL